MPRTGALLGRVLRRIEAVFGRGPYTRIRRLNHQVNALQALLDEQSDVLDAKRRQSAAVQARLDDTRDRLRWSPPHSFGWNRTSQSPTAPRQRSQVVTALSDPSRRPQPWTHTLHYLETNAPNPYVRLLNSQLATVGVRPQPNCDLYARSRAAGDVVHVHWPLSTLGTHNTLASFSEAARRSLDAIDQGRAAGMRLVRTIHQFDADPTAWPEAAASFEQSLLERADIVHVLHESTAEVLTANHGVDGTKILVVEHPLYTGYYPDFVDRATARRELGLDDDDVLVLLFGAIRTYKGFDRIVRNVDVIRERSGLNVKVLVAGGVPMGQTAADFGLGPTSNPHVKIQPRMVPDDVVQYLFRSADLAVLPYRPGSLNSGVLLLAWTFGVPVIGPDTPVVRDLAQRGPVRTFAAASDDDLIDVIATALRDRWFQDSELSPSTAETLAPQRIARMFAEQLAARLTS